MNSNQRPSKEIVDTILVLCINKYSEKHSDHWKRIYQLASLDIWKDIGIFGHNLPGIIISEGVFCFQLDNDFLIQLYREESSKTAYFITDWDRGLSNVASFEEFFSLCLQDIKLKLLYHLDLFKS